MRSAGFHHKSVRSVLQAELSGQVRAEARGQPGREEWEGEGSLAEHEREQLTGVVIKGAEVVVKGQTLVKGWARGLRRHWRVRWAYGGGRQAVAKVVTSVMGVKRVWVYGRMQCRSVDGEVVATTKGLSRNVMVWFVARSKLEYPSQPGDHELRQRPQQQLAAAVPSPLACRPSPELGNRAADFFKGLGPSKSLSSQSVRRKHADQAADKRHRVNKP